MENKVFDLLEKVYIEVQETKKTVKEIIGRQDKMEESLARMEGRQDKMEESLNRMEDRQDKMDESFARMEGCISRLEIKVEHEISNKLDALFEFRDEAIQRFDRIDKKLDDLSEKVDKHDISIQVIQGGKSKRTV